MVNNKMSLKLKIFCLLLIQYVCAESPLSVTKPVADSFGVNIHFTHPNVGELEMIRESGFKWVRMDFFWERTETQKGVYNFSDYEFLLSQLDKQNMSAYYILDYNNKIYENVITESGRKAYAKWAATAVEHFKGKGIVWEIWNEPNGDGFWNGHHDVHQYVPMALEAMKAIREKSPKEIVIGPATSGVDFNFLEVCLSSGLLNYWDAVSVHPYRQSNPETVYEDYILLRAMIEKYKPKGKHIPIVSGEWGYSDVWKGFNETIQGKYLQRELLTNVMHKIPLSIWYDWHNDGTNATDPESHFGTVNFAYQKGKTPVYIPKEAYLAAKTMNTVLKGFHFVKRIATKSNNDYVLLFSNGKDLRLVVWSTEPANHNISIPSDKCDFDIIHHKGSPIQNTSANGGSVILTLNDFTHLIVVKGPNHALESAPEANVINIEVMAFKGSKLLIRLTQILGESTNGTIKLTNIKGIDPIVNETTFQMNDSVEKTIGFGLKKVPETDITVGVKVERNGVVTEVPPHTYHFSSDNVINHCIVTPDGDPKIQSEQSVSTQTVTDKEFATNVNVLNIKYHFYGQGWKFIRVIQNKTEDRKISGQPKGFGFWLYGDSQGMTFKMRLIDANKQVFQMRPQSRNVINWNGFRFITIKISDIESHWGGPNDGVIKYPVEFDTLLLIDNVNHLVVNSSIAITAPVIMY